MDSDARFYIDWDDTGLYGRSSSSVGPVTTHGTPPFVIPPHHVEEWSLDYGCAVDLRTRDPSILAAGLGHITLFDESGLYYKHSNAPGRLTRQQLETPHNFFMTMNGETRRKGTVRFSKSDAITDDVQSVSWNLDGRHTDVLLAQQEFKLPLGPGGGVNTYHTTQDSPGGPYTLAQAVQSHIQTQSGLPTVRLPPSQIVFISYDEDSTRVGGVYPNRFAGFGGGCRRQGEWGTLISIIAQILHAWPLETSDGEVHVIGHNEVLKKHNDIEKLFEGGATPTEAAKSNAGLNYEYGVDAGIMDWGVLSGQRHLTEAVVTNLNWYRGGSKQFPNVTHQVRNDRRMGPNRQARHIVNIPDWFSRDQGVNRFLVAGANQGVPDRAIQLNFWDFQTSRADRTESDLQAIQAFTDGMQPGRIIRGPVPDPDATPDANGLRYTIRTFIVLRTLITGGWGRPTARTIIGIHPEGNLSLLTDPMVPHLPVPIPEAPASTYYPIRVSGTPGARVRWRWAVVAVDNASDDLPNPSWNPGTGFNLLTATDSSVPADTREPGDSPRGTAGPFIRRTGLTAGNVIEIQMTTDTGTAWDPELVAVTRFTVSAD